MTTIRLETAIAAAPERVFDLALDLGEHAKSAAATRERVVRTTAVGPMRLGDEVEFEARHLGLRWRLAAKIIAYDRPRHFADEQTRGPFRAMRHDHRFDRSHTGTSMRDEFAFSAPGGRLVEIVLAGHLRRFLKERAAYLKATAEKG